MLHHLSKTPLNSASSSEDKDKKGSSTEAKEVKESPTTPETTKTKKKRARGRRRKGKTRPKVEPVPKKQPASKKHHDAPMKKRDLYFSMTCSMVGIKGGSSVVARVTIVNWDMEMVLDTFVFVPVPVVDFKDSGVAPTDIRKSKSNTRAKSFSEVRQIVEQLLRGKILIGHDILENLNALGLTHPDSDVRDTALFFKNKDLRDLSKILLRKELPPPGSPDIALESCATALTLYQANRKEWEEELIKKSQESQQQMLMHVTQVPVQGSPHYQEYIIQEPLRSRLPSGEISPPYMVQSYPHGPPIHHAIPPQHLQDNASWFLRGPPDASVAPQPVSAPALSSRAMQALSSYSYPPSPYDDRHDRGSSVSYDGSTLYESSNDFNSSAFDNRSQISESIGTGSVASWQEDDTPEKRGSSSWFRFGVRKASVPPSNNSPYRRNLQRRMSAVCEEQEDDEIAALASRELHLPQLGGASQEGFVQGKSYEDGEDISKQTSSSSSWFGFRRSKSPSVGKKDLYTEDSQDDLDNSRSHAYRELANLALAKTASDESNPSSSTTLLSADDYNAYQEDRFASLPETSNSEKSSSWFSFRRSKSPSASKQVSVDRRPSDPTVSTYDGNDEDWMQEVMQNKGSTKGVSISNVEGDAKPGSSPAWFRFLRSPKTTRSRLPSLDDDAVAESIGVSTTQSVDENSERWMEEAVGHPSPENTSPPNDEWNISPSTSSQGGLFFSPARARLPTESTIQSAVTEEKEEDDGSLSGELLEGIEQNLAFLNI